MSSPRSMTIRASRFPRRSMSATALAVDRPWDITVLSNGAYALTWISDFAAHTDLFTAVFTADGQQAVGPVNVTDSTGIDETFAQATALADGAYALSWEGGSPAADLTCSRRSISSSRPRRR